MKIYTFMIINIPINIYNFMIKINDFMIYLDIFEN